MYLIMDSENQLTIISLIGMSGAGKTYWSKKLAKTGFDRICVDNIIEEKLAPSLRKLGFLGIQDMAIWMGQPYEQYYQTRAGEYLNQERHLAINRLLVANESRVSDEDEGVVTKLEIDVTKVK